ncbi:hypothetical protein NSMM_510016 [Nitrosomonas mobilis]|uniref:Lipoprotein n=2 Tax=Nitrosomonas mobilis TaxID=51642 RepID=A0A1G5SGQ6_9PROT|nr:hypothetical protein NSMM_510016 [Nitrosomonas mobilis]
MAVALVACDSKKHPMDKPPPSAFIERESAPDMDKLDEAGSDTSSSEEN